MEPRLNSLSVTQGIKESFLSFFWHEFLLAPCQMIAKLYLAQ